MGKKKRGMPGLEPAMRRFVHAHIRGRKPRRLHMSPYKTFSMKKFREAEQTIEMKPTGIWYGLGDSWIQWCMSEASGWLSPYIYDFVLDEDKILKVTNIEEFEKFEEEHQAIRAEFKLLMDHMPKIRDAHGDGFGRRMSRFFDQIDWPKLATMYSGVEIAPYIWKKRLESMWYYPWDCASGCIWNRSAVKELRLFAAYDKESDEFIRMDLQPRKPRV